MTTGLSLLRNQLETLICSQSITKVEELLNDCGGDHALMNPWPRLKGLFLSHNFIERFDRSLTSLIALEVLDVSHNRLHDCSTIFDFLPKLQHLNLSCNLLRVIPVWSMNSTECNLLTLKMRQNRIESVTGIDLMSSIEELDLSENFITTIPQQLRLMTKLKKVNLAGNPISYHSNYRQEILMNLPLECANPERIFYIDDRRLTSKDKYVIPRMRPAARTQLALYSSGISSQTQSESTTEASESVVSNSTGTIVSRRKPRRRRKDRFLHSTDNDETVTEQGTSRSGSETELIKHQLEKLKESRQKFGQDWLLTQTNFDTTINVGNGYNEQQPITTVISDEQDLAEIETTVIIQSPKKRKTPRMKRNSGSLNQLVFQVVDDGNSTDQQYQTMLSETESQRSDSVKTTFIVSVQLTPSITDMSTSQEYSAIVEISALHLIEKDAAEECLAQIKYSSINLKDNSHSSDNKIVEFTWEHPTGKRDLRRYVFDTVNDRDSFIDEIQRFLKPAVTSVQELIQYEVFL
ncbi:unnamed protein product [Didymodactylos carnosus]|uniref:Uncharacterized protein n=1 Tax=Didymodactylos carnosus TaxID=1234261 RepID=A0A8S2SPT0_9BILA|nr:unnamed protein product [Didymodactylos carnosus]CAF4245075.1 unnamed protein product [Didymodactylos carnosus]